MAKKKKTEDKELKPKAPTKKEAVKMPDTAWVMIKMGGKEYRVGRDLAKTLIDSKKATLVG